MIYKNNHRAFTIVELLSAIVVIGIIALIAIPSVLNLVDDSKKESLKVTAKSLADGAKGFAMTSGDGTVKTFTIENGKFVGDKIPVSGTLPSSGTVMVNENLETALAVVQGKWCAKKNYSDSQVTISEDIGNCNMESAFATPSSCFLFNSDNGTITGYYDHEGNISSNTACPNDVVIPSKINNVAVTSIGPGSFITSEKYGQYCYTYNPETGEYGADVDVGLDYIHNDSDGYYECYYSYNYDNRGRITSVIIPNSVTSISYSAFEHNQLTNVAIGNSVTTISNGAFYDNSLTSIVIPNSVTTIGNNAFYGNQLNNATIGDNVTTIGQSAFGWNQLTSIVIPNSVTTLGNDAFKSNQLTSLDISGLTNLTTLGDDAFYNNQLTSLDMSSLTNLTKISDWAFSYNQLSSVIIPNSVTVIGSGAFNDNQLTSLIIPSSVTSIGNSAFDGNRLVNITIPSSVTNIGTSSFHQTSSYPWGTVTIKYNTTNLANRFDSQKSDIGWGSATMSYVSD